MKRLSERTILAIGWVVAIVLAYPGFVDDGAANELIAARDNRFTDWYSSVQEAVWRKLELLLAGPAPMLFLQVSLTLFGSYVLLARRMPSRSAAKWACLVTLFPSAFATLGLISPPALMAGGVLAGWALVTSPQRRWKLAGLATLIIAAGILPIAAFAVAPIILADFAWSPAPPRRYAIALVATVAVIAGSIGLRVGLTDIRDERDDVVGAAQEIAFVVAHMPARDDAAMRAWLPMVELYGDHLYEQLAERGRRGRSPFAAPTLLFEPDTEQSRSALYAARDVVVRGQASVMRAYRARIALRVIGLSRGKTWRPYYAKLYPSVDMAELLANRAKISVPEKWTLGLLRILSSTPLFWPYVYLVVLLALLPLALLRRNRAALLAIASSIAFEAALILTAVTPTFRDSHWLLVGTLVAIAFSWPRSRQPVAEQVEQRDPLPPAESPAPASAA